MKFFMAGISDMYEHWELWAWNGEGWNRKKFTGEHAEGMAQLEYGRHIIGMPYCPAKLVRVTAEDEWEGKSRDKR